MISTKLRKGAKMRRYRLLQFMPGLDKGAIFEETKLGYKAHVMHDGIVSYVGLPKFAVEERGTWFEVVTECNHQVTCQNCHSVIDL